MVLGDFSVKLGEITVLCKDLMNSKREGTSPSPVALWDLEAFSCSLVGDVQITACFQPEFCYLLQNLR